jgi:hypothetical protein
MVEETMRAMLGLTATNNLGRDLFAAFIAALAGMAVLLYAAASDLFDLKFFKFDPFSLRYPREARIEYWYVRAARRFQAFLASGGWSYAKFKKRLEEVPARDAPHAARGRPAVEPGHRPGRPGHSRGPGGLADHEAGLNG